MDASLIERRGAHRVSGETMAIVQATLRPGCPVRVIDISSAGVQVESARPLRPGTRVHVRLASDHRSLVLFAQIIRCHVWALDPDTGVKYRGALEFDERCTQLASLWHEAPAAAL